MKHLRIVALLGALLGGAVLASASAAQAALDTIPVRTTSADEYTPSSQGAWFSWVQASHAHPNHPDVLARRGSGSTIKVNAPGTNGGGGGIDGHTLVYYEYRGTYAADIRKFNLRTRRRSNFPAKVSTHWDEYHPTISAHWVLFTRYFDTTNTTKVLLYNTQTHALRALGSDRGRHRGVYSGQVNGDYAVWGRIRPGGWDVYLYRISTKTNTIIPRLVFAQYNPSVASDGTIYYGRSGNGCGASVSLVRRPLGGTSTVLHDFPAGTDIGYGYVDERTDGSVHRFFGQVNCRNGRWDIYKVIDSHTVSITKAGSGTGTVASDPAGIDCGAVCAATFHGGLTVTLTATADSGSLFGGWSDPSCGTNATCPVSVESDVSVTATFDPSP